MNYKTDELLKQAQANEDESSISSAEKSFADDPTAASVFAKLRRMLVSVDEWNDHSMMSSFALFDERGKMLEHAEFELEKFVRISLKGAVKYDWVRVFDIYETADEFVLTVKPSFDPTDKNRDKSAVSHFFSDASTNNFCLFRKGVTVALYVIGLNEKRNSKDAKGALETIHNAAVNVASYFGMQEMEWGKFCSNFLEDVSKEN